MSAAVPVIGVGASAGGLEALREMLGGHSEPTGMAFVVVQHLDPTHESLMAQLLERYTQMDVRQAVGGERLSADHIYVIPPGHGLAVEDGTLRLTEFSDPRGQRKPIDDFLLSLAADRQALCASVILSGTGADGSRGLRAIKEVGGVTIAQAPDSARYDGMPVSAISTGLVDVVAAPGDIIGVLRNFFARSAGGLEDEAEEVTDHIDEMCDVLKQTIGHDFSRYKRSTLTRRIARRMQVLSIDNAADYLARIRGDEDECNALFQDLLINVTRFFRDSDEFDALNRTTIDKMVRLARDGQELRVWVPGASSGEEPYSLAMLFAEAMRRHQRRPFVQIFATDIDDRTLDLARAANYPLSALADIPEDFQHRYVIGNADSFTLVPQIRDMVRLSVHNLVSDPPFSKIDLLSCRNLLIYFDDQLQRQVLPLFHFALRDSGTLFLGTSEGIGRFDDLFEIVDQKARIFRRRNVKSQYSLQASKDLAPTYARRRQRSSDSGQPPAGNLSELAALRRIAERYAPVSFLVDSEGTLLQKWGAAGKYLEFPDRHDRNLHIPTLARPGLRETIGPMLRRAVDGQNRVVTRAVRMMGEYGYVDATVMVEPVSEGGYLIVIKDAGTFEPFADDTFEEFEAGDGQLQFLEEELQATRHRLRSAVEELETTNEELKSSNEEMMSMNEELQSTNEELTTVNDELKAKVDQVTIANSDLKNFFATTELIVVVVDSQLAVRSFTDAAQSAFRIGERDLGMPLADIGSRLASNRHVEAVQRAARDGKTTEYRTSTIDGKADYIARIIPYRRLDGTIDGATIVLTDVTEALRLERELGEERERLRLALEVAKVGIWEYEPSSDRTVLDQAERDLLDLADDEGDTMEPILARLPAADRDRINIALRRAMDGDRDFDETFALDLRAGGRRWLHGLGRRIVAAGEKKFIGVTYDITAERELLAAREVMVREMNHRVKNLFAVISAMVALVGRQASDVDSFGAELRARIDALGRSHALTARGDGSQGTLALRDLLLVALEASATGQEVALDGPDVALPAALVTPLAMILYEWTTNSAKYGALAQSDGDLRVAWSVDDDAVRIDWRETGSMGAESAGSGFGTRLLEMTARQLGGEIEGQKTADGYVRRLQFPV